MKIEDYSAEQLAMYADALKTNPIFVNAFDVIKQRTIKAMEDLKGRQFEEDSRRLVMMIQVIDAFEFIIKQYIDTGKIVNDRRVRLAKR